MILPYAIIALLVLLLAVVGVYFFHARKYSYFIFYELDKIEDNNNFNKVIAKFVKRYFYTRGAVTRFFEPFTPPGGLVTFLIFGTAQVDRGGRMNRNAFIFIMELYAQIENPEAYQVDANIKHILRKIDGEDIHIYRIPKNGPYEKKK